MNDMKNMWDFPVLEGVSFPNANRVHPLMQRRVQTMICELGKDQNVRKLILFGSSWNFAVAALVILTYTLKNWI